jgi:hypothetical protein
MASLRSIYVGFASLAILANAGAVERSGPVVLPIEVAGEAGTEATVTVDIPSGLGSEVRRLCMQIHNLEFAGMASVRINQGPWLALTNTTATVAEPGRSYGGIGGGFATLKLTVPVAPGSVADGSNSIGFRFNGTNGVASGFRVLALNFLTADGRIVLPGSAFRDDDPNAWAPSFRDPENISAGQNLWHSAKLTANGLPGAPPIHAHCADCHTRDGRDLKYFNFSNTSIAARSRFHGLSELQGRQIASYIRSLDVPNPGRPWNPPYQPGPGLDAKPPADWAAGAGLSWVLADDLETIPFLLKGKDQNAFRPDGDLNAREIPIAFQLPDWNHWLPRVHPLDAWGERFERSAFAQEYASGAHTADELHAFFDSWSRSRGKFLKPPDAKKWTAELAETYYSAQLWQLVKTWEITQIYGTGADARNWPNTVPAAAAPTSADIPDGPAGMGGSGLTNEYYSAAWYELQVVVNSGNHRHRGHAPIDWPYITGHFLDLERLSGRPEPGRLLVTLIKGMQSTDPGAGPENYNEGWRPEQDVDPRIMVGEEWTPEFATLPPNVKTAITESFLVAWLDKTLQYPPASYFQRGLRPAAYVWPESLRNVSGGRVWEAASQFQKAGVSDPVIQRLLNWGSTWNAMAGLFHY